MAPGGKIPLPPAEVNQHLATMTAIAEAMAGDNHWDYLAQYSILKTQLSDLHTIVGSVAFKK